MANLNSTSMLGSGPPVFTCPSFGEIVLDGDDAKRAVVRGRFEEVPLGESRTLLSGEAVQTVLGIRAYWEIKLPVTTADTARSLALVWTAAKKKLGVRFCPARDRSIYEMEVLNDGPFPLEHFQDNRSLGMKVTLKFRSRYLLQEIPLPLDVWVGWSDGQGWQV